jgi:putative FmdB family regulatory protein
MPRYRYECEKCTRISIIFHTLKEKVTDCSVCGEKDSLRKLLSIPIVRGLNVQEEEQQIGDLTNEKIEENREVLQKQKKEMKEKDYDKT